MIIIFVLAFILLAIFAIASVFIFGAALLIFSVAVILMLIHVLSVLL